MSETININIADLPRLTDEQLEALYQAGDDVDLGHVMRLVVEVRELRTLCKDAYDELAERSSVSSDEWPLLLRLKQAVPL